ncbi:hypothetical protein ACI65C_006341 [Semiaphis heraclei]
MDTNTYTSDTGWTTQTNKRNHSSSSNSTSNPSSPTASNLNKKNKIFATPNRFQSLAQDEPSQKLSNEANPQDCVETDEVPPSFAGFRLSKAINSRKKCQSALYVT